MLYQQLKSEVKATGLVIREMRNGEVKLRNHMRHERSFQRLIDAEVERVTGSPRNYHLDGDLNVFEVQRSSIYRDRMTMKQLARNINLAYAIVRGVPYRDVENTVREGNEPDVDGVYESLGVWTSCITHQDIEEWINEA